MSRDDSADAFDLARETNPRSRGQRSPLRLWTVHETFDGPLTARVLTPDERMAYGRGELRVHCVIVAADEADATSFALRLRSARHLLGMWPSTDYRTGYRNALSELKAFVNQETERHEALYEDDSTSREEYAGAVSALERLNTWAQAFMPTEPAPPRTPDEEPLG